MEIKWNHLVLSEAVKKLRNHSDVKMRKVAGGKAESDAEMAIVAVWWCWQLSLEQDKGHPQFEGLAELGEALNVVGGGPV